MPHQHIHVLLLQHGRQCIRRSPKIQQSAAFRLLQPFIVIAVAVEQYPLVLLYSAAYKVVQCTLKILRAFQLIGILSQGLRNGGIYHDVGAGYAVG